MLKKNIFYCLIISMFCGCTQKLVYDSKQLYLPADFISHAQEKSPYLAQNVSYSEVKNIKESLEVKIGKKLKSRGEAHITVISPPEYKVLKEKLTMTAIDEIALINKIQDYPFEALCVGKGQLVNDESVETYFIVVKSKALLELRKKINTTYIQSGGDHTEFDVDVFYPHITLGYTERDLHLLDGVVKNSSSCYVQMQEKPVVP